jgi:two-component system chemotaxis response regulator CheB
MLNNRRHFARNILPSESQSRIGGANGRREQTHDIVVLGASAGGVEALITFVAGLPPNLQAALFVVLHFPPDVPSVLDRILAHAGKLSAKMAEDEEPIATGNIYIAPPDYHLLLTETAMRITHGPHENWHRPAVDPLFRTAAIAYGARVVGIVLSGALNDGTAGLIAIKRRGGLTLVQDPSTAVFPSMPQSACTYAAIDYCLSVPALAEKVVELSGVTVSSEERQSVVPSDMDLEAKVAGLDPTVLDDDTHVGTISELTCPQCRGPLWEIHDGQLLRFRCRVGHAFTAEALVEGQSQTVERNLWMAVNSLEESTQMYSRLALSAHAHGDHRAQDFDEKVRRFQERTRLIREIILAPSEQVSSIGG